MQMALSFSDMINSAKARVRYMLLQELYSIIQPFLKEGRCLHAASIVFGFMLELEKMRASFLEIQAPNTSATKLIRRLQGFQFSYTECCAGDRNCVAPVSLSHKVETALLVIEDYIEGLCLSCIDSPDASKHNLKDCPLRGEKTWQGHVYTCGFKAWDTGCEVKHGQPTWYFSSTASEFNHKRLYND